MFKTLMTYLDRLDEEKASMGVVPRAMVWLLARPAKLLLYMLQGLSTHATMVRSAALTYYTLVSIVPVVALVFAVVKGFGLADGLVQNLYSVFPQIPEVVDYLVEFAQKALARTQGGLVALFSLVALFWSVWSVFGSIEDAFNNIWEVKSTRSWSRKISDYITVIVFAPILWVGASAVSVYLRQLLGWADNMWLNALSKLISMAIAWFMFSLIYVVLPNTKVNLSAAIKSGFIAGTVFMLFQWGYVFVQTWMTSYNAIYGSFAALPLFLLWMLISWSILLLGGELSFTFQNEKRFDEERESLLVSYDCRRKLMVGVMVIVARTFRDGKGAMAVDDIRHALGIPKRILSSVLSALVEAGMLHEIHIGGKEFELSYAPARDISTLKVYDVLLAVDAHGEGRDSIDVSEPTELYRASQVVEELKMITLDSKANCRILDLL
ncbi:MAG: YihY family inner membrane protein [Alistipes sp.]|nr:YihY family inner membrane protein [Alistipes sp.]